MKLLSRLAESASATLPEDLVRPEEWRRPLASLIGALLVGLLAIGFALAGDSVRRVEVGEARPEDGLASFTRASTV